MVVSFLKTLAIEPLVVQLQLIELKDDLVFKMFHKSRPTIEFWKQSSEHDISETKIKGL